MTNPDIQPSESKVSQEGIESNIIDLTGVPLAEIGNLSRDARRAIGVQVLQYVRNPETIVIQSQNQNLLPPKIETYSPIAQVL